MTLSHVLSSLRMREAPIEVEAYTEAKFRENRMNVKNHILRRAPEDTRRGRLEAQTGLETAGPRKNGLNVKHIFLMPGE